MNQVAKQTHPAEILREQLQGQREQFAASMPAHMVDRFMRVVMNAINSNPDLMNCTRKSLWMSCLRAAQDGLLPDGRQGAIVPYKKEAQFIPMYQGILKKVRNSGKLKDLTVELVHEGDQFRRWNDENGKHLEHIPVGREDDDAITHAYAIARTKDGGVYIDVMGRAALDKTRAVATAAKGPWADWYGEMAKKTVLRRLSKMLPMSTDLDDLIRRDDDLYDLEGTAQESSSAAKAAGIQSATVTALDSFANAGQGEQGNASTGKTDASGTSAPDDKKATPEAAETVLNQFQAELDSPHDENSLQQLLQDFEPAIDKLDEKSQGKAMAAFEKRLAAVRASTSSD